MFKDRDAYFTPYKDTKRITDQLFEDHPEFKDYDFVEPSAGSGNFMKAVEAHGLKIDGYDIHPKSPEVIQHDFLEDDLDLSGKIVIGNPPYGKKSGLALKFIDRAFEQGAEAVCFLLMGTFATFSTLARLTQPIELLSIRDNLIEFENDEGEVVPCLASVVKTFFMVFKRGTQRIKDQQLSTKYSKATPLDADFGVGFKFFEAAENLPKLDEKPVSGINTYRIIESKKRKRISTYKCSGKFDKPFLEYLSRFNFLGRPTDNTMNFFENRRHILKDFADNPNATGCDFLSEIA